MANQWLTGSGVPSTGIGQVTDYYRDTVNNLVYYRENAFTWVVVPAFTPSPDGIGTTWLHGATAPLTAQGSDGDYFYEDTHKIVYRKEGATWVAKGSLDFIGIYGVQWGNGLGAPVSNVPLDALPAGSFYLDVVTSDIYYKGPSMSWELKGQLGNGDGTSVDVVGVGASSFVRYDVAQTLSNDDKARVQTTLGMSIYALTSSLSSYLTTSTASSTYGTIAQAKAEYLVCAASDESTALTAGTTKVTFRMPYAMTLSAVRCSLTTAQTSGSIFTVDINSGGTTILSTKLTIDNTEKTSTTAATAAVISDVNLADDAEITIDIDQVGNGTAKGLKITLIGTRA